MTVNEGGFAPGQHAINASDRHPATQQVARWFDFEHLPEGEPRDVSKMCAFLAADMIGILPDGDEQC